MAKSIQACRKAAGYRSAREFAEENGLNVVTYVKYEQGTSKPSLNYVTLLADLFGCSVDQVIGREPPTTTVPRKREVRILEAYRSAKPALRQVFDDLATVVESMQR